MTAVIGAEGRRGASGVAGSMLGTFLWVWVGWEVTRWSEVWDAEAAVGDMRGEIVGGWRGEETSSEEGM